jgi:hypothetical protein
MAGFKAFSTDSIRAKNVVYSMHIMFGFTVELINREGIQ